MVLLRLSLIPRLIAVAAIEVLLAVVVAFVDPQLLVQNAAWLAPAAFLALIIAGLWDQVREFVAWKRGRSENPETSTAQAIANAQTTLGEALGYDSALRYELAIADIEPLFLSLRKAKMPIPELRRDGFKLGALRAHRYLNAIYGPLVVGDKREAMKRAAEAVPALEAKSAADLWKDVQDGYGGGPIEPPKPDMPMDELAHRIYAKKGPMPPEGYPKRQYLDDVSREIMRGIIFNHLHLWAHEGEYRFEPIPPDVLKRAQLLHENSTLSYLPGPDAAKRRWLTGLELNREQVDKVWPK